MQVYAYETGGCEFSQSINLHIIFRHLRGEDAAAGRFHGGIR